MTREATAAGVRRDPAGSHGDGPVTIRLADQLAGRLRWLIGIRLVVITSVLLPTFLFEIATPSPGRDLGFLYLLAGATYLASLLYIALLKLLESHAALQAYIQFSGDLLLVTGLVYYFGGISSPFSILYLIVVIVASILLERRAGLSVATIAWVLYAATVVAIYFGWVASPQDPRAPAESIGRLAYYLAIHFFGLYAVALMTSRLAQSVTVAERELREKREDLADLQVAHRDVIESIPSGLITTDRAGNLTSVNRAAQDILGKSEEELLARPIENIGLFSAEAWERLTGNGPAAERGRREVEYLRDGKVLQIGYSLSLLTTAEGAPSGHILIFQDLSEWRKLQEEVRIKDRMAAVGELASGIAHEIGNPLAAISGSVQMLSSTLEGQTSQQKLLTIIHKESQRLDRTIKGFLKFARPKERASVRFDIAALLTEHVELLRNSSEVSEGHRLIVDLMPSSVSIIADPDQISQIFWNLARNALRAMPGGGTLRIEGTLEDSGYRVHFIDDGRGMTEEERANLFHPFHSFFDAGSGIGMAIVYQIVQEHGGRLLVESSPGRGTTITVELPVGKPAAVTTVPVGA